MRCTERGFLQLDHRKPKSIGGQPTIAGMRYLCAAHNQYEAERILGADFMRAKRTEAAAKRAAAPPAQPASPAAPPDAARIDADVTLALTGLGFTRAETTRAMSVSAEQPAPTFEARIRAALAELTRSRPTRCSDGPPAYAAHPGAVSRRGSCIAGHSA